MSGPFLFQEAAIMAYCVSCGQNAATYNGLCEPCREDFATNERSVSMMDDGELDLDYMRKSAKAYKHRTIAKAMLEAVRAARRDGSRYGWQ